MATRVQSLLERRLSVERLAPYRAECAGDLNRAIALYEWNSDLAAAFWRTLGQVEIALRNAMHSTLADWAANTHGRVDWYADPARILTGAARADISAATRRATRARTPDTKSKTGNPGRIVAELSFGFWRYLLAAKYDRTLWRMCLHQAFPGSSGSRREVHDAVARLHELRNRIAHHEPIHNRPLPRMHDEALRVVNWICPDTRGWIESGCRVPDLLGHRPT